MDDYFLIGEIKSAYADEGFVLVYSYSDYTNRFFDLEFVLIEIFGVKKKIFIDRVETSGNDILIKFKNFESRKQVEVLVGSKLYVDENNVISLDEGTYFIHDLVGCKIFYNDLFFGDVVDFLQLETNGVYVVNGTDNQEHLVPSLTDFIKSVDVVNKRIELVYDWDSMFYDED